VNFEVLINEKNNNMNYLTKRSNWPFNGTLLSDFFSNSWMPSSLNDEFKALSIPAVNIKETEEEFQLELAAPGITKKDLNISVEKGLLNISAETKSQMEEKEDSYTLKEFNYKSFNRSFKLPENINENDIVAKYKEGILQLSIPKNDDNLKSSAKQITIT